MANNEKVSNKVCLVIIDGWGITEQKYGNAILGANTPVMDKLCSDNSTQIEAHGLHVGLPEGLMGNSEVGHLNIGGGRVVMQDIVRINLAVKNNTIVKNDALIAACERARSGTGRIHLAGLVSDGGVHSHTGSYYAMDRDRRWERIRVAYDAMVGGQGEEAAEDKLVDVVRSRYEAGETDEFLKPIIVGGAARRVKDGDTLLFFDYRADRMREISEVMGMERYNDCHSKFTHPKNVKVFGMTRYKAEFPFPTLFPVMHHENVLADWLAKQGFSQFHCAETEKYAHVTFFLNGGVEKAFENEERCLLPSPKVATYDLQPEMACAEIGEKMVEQIVSGQHPFVMCNFAAPDMVGHTGLYEAAVKACKATDVAIGRIYEACKKHGYILLVTADHGNVEKMITSDGEKHTAHTCNPVPFTCSSDKFKFKKLTQRRPALCDVACTVLDIMGIPQPQDMTGVSLVDRILM